MYKYSLFRSMIQSGWQYFQDCSCAYSAFLTQLFIIRIARLRSMKLCSDSAYCARERSAAGGRAGLRLRAQGAQLRCAEALAPLTASCGIRAHDLPLTKRVLCQLS